MQTEAILPEPMEGIKIMENSGSLKEKMEFRPWSVDS